MSHPRRLITAFLAAFAAIIGTFAAAGPASAYTWQDSAGRAGYVQLWQTQGVHIRQCSTAYYYTCRMAPGVHVQAQRVYRSPSTTGRQDVAVAINIQRWNGSSWVYQTGRTLFRSIPAGTGSIVMPEWTVLPNQVNYLRVRIGVAWSTPTGKALGGRAITMNQQGDYACATNLRPCEAGPGWLFIREPGV